MKLRILLINPWIYDFAAAHFWSMPLGLFRVAECLSRFDVDTTFIDCTNINGAAVSGRGKYPKEIVKKPESIRSVPRRFGRYGIPIDDFKKALVKSLPFDMVFITSIMSYWYPGVQKAIEVIRDFHKEVPIVLGGIYATLWKRHASETSGADFIYRGPVGEDISFVFTTFGYKLRKRRGETPYHRLTIRGPHTWVPLLTGSGCPYRCSYCGSHLLSEGLHRKEVDGIVEEIEELYRMGIRDFVFYDDALLVDAERHIKVILKEIIRRGLDVHFHCPNGLHARFIDDEIAEMMSVAGFRTLRLGLETVDGGRQQSTGGKVTSGNLVEAVTILKKYGFTKNDIGVYLMHGLPGQDFEEVREGVEFLKWLDVRIHLAEFSPIPGTQCWSELIGRGVITDDIDPLLTNNTVFSYLFSGYKEDEMNRLKLAVKDHNSAPSIFP